MLSGTARREVWRGALVVAVVLGAAGAAAAPQAEIALGDWNLKVEWPNRQADVLLSVTRKDGALAATWTGPQGTLNATEVVLTDGVLTFTIAVEDQSGSEVPLRFRGRIAKDRLDGQLATARGMTIKVSGRRKAQRAGALKRPALLTAAAVLPPQQDLPEGMSHVARVGRSRGSTDR